MSKHVYISWFVDHTQINCVLGVFHDRYRSIFLMIMEYFLSSNVLVLYASILKTITSKKRTQAEVTTRI